MRGRANAAFILGALLLVLAFACTPASTPTPSPTPTAAPTAVVTLTPLPTLTPTPTREPGSTATPPPGDFILPVGGEVESEGITVGVKELWLTDTETVVRYWHACGERDLMESFGAPKLVVDSGPVLVVFEGAGGMGTDPSQPLEVSGGTVLGGLGGGGRGCDPSEVKQYSFPPLPGGTQGISFRFGPFLGPDSRDLTLELPVGPYLARLDPKFGGETEMDMVAESEGLAYRFSKLTAGVGNFSLRYEPANEAARSVRDALVADPPLSVTEGYLVKEGFSPEVDELRELATGGKRWVLELEARERERTGIKSLKVSFNKVFGYYIEVTRSNLSSVPADYVRRQTLSTGERYITAELREKEAAILGAEEKLHREEYRIFCEVRDFLWECIRRIQRTARAVAELDVLVSLAQVAAENGYARPEVVSGGDIVIRDGRHPVLEKVLPSGGFVPNDLALDSKQRILVITGPNMGGKSTYCRQAALIVLMAQIGSFVPASSCSVSCVDKLFARVGAYDDLVLGQSTFMVEMSEVSRILKGVTPNSLVILDEIGRGTSTFDGLAVAWAVLEHLCGNGNGNDGAKRSGPRALVATHYRELTLLADLKPGVANYNVSVRKKGDDVVFLRKVVRGVAEGSFGIEVSAMAGMPDSVVRRAREILLGLEAEARKGARWKTGILGQVASRSAGVLKESVPGQDSLFGRVVVAGKTAGETAATLAGAPVSRKIAQLVEELVSLDVDKLSPLAALEKLYEIKANLALLGPGGERKPGEEG